MSDNLVADGQELLEIAEDAWSESRQEYRGFKYMIAVNQALRQIERVRGGRKARKEEARHTVSVLFTQALTKSARDLGSIAREASSQTPVDGGDMFEFAAEVAAACNGPMSGGYGVIDPSMIIGLIQAIIGAISACKKPPTTTPHP